MMAVGSFLDAAFSVCTNRSTIEGYATAFRKIVADLFGLATNPAKFDCRSAGDNCRSGLDFRVNVGICVVGCGTFSKSVE